MSTATQPVNSAATTPAPALNVAEFVDGQLAFLQRRASPEERAKIRWWRERVGLLAKQEPRAEPVEPAAA